MTKLKLVLTGVLVLAFAGCKTKIDNEKAESAIKSGFKDQTGKALKSMSCPSGLESKAGSTFECKGATDDGTDVVVTVTIKDDQGNVTWKVTSVGGQTAPADDKKAAPPAPADDKKAEPAPAADEHKGGDEHKQE